MPPDFAQASHSAWKALVVCPHPAIAQRILSVLDQPAPGPVTMTEYPRMGTAAGLAQRSGCNICFLDVATNAEHAQALISELSPSIPVVALDQRNDADLILRCLRRGACEFLSDPSAESLHNLFERLARAQAPLARKAAGTVYCVVPGKPGCGASTVAAHLAVCARAAGSPRVLLVDADPLTGSVAFQLKIKGEFHLGDVLRDWKRMDEDLWSRLTVGACGVDVLAAPESAATRIDVSRQMAGELYAFWRERYETVVLDLPDARAAADSGFAALADTVLLVTTNELAALQATRRALECLDQAGCARERLRLVLNRYTPATGLKRGDVIKALTVDPFAVLCNDYETIQTALLDGRPAPAASRFSTSIAALLAGLQNKLAPEKKRMGWFSPLRHRK